MVGEMVDSSLCSERDVGDAVPSGLPFRAWLQRRVGLEPTPTLIFSKGDGENETLAYRERVRVRNTRFVHDITSIWQNQMVESSLCSDAFSGMVTKKGRFGTDPTLIFSKRDGENKTLALRERVRVRTFFSFSA